MDEKILISGASGFLGKALLEQLLGSNKQIIALYNTNPRPKIYDQYANQLTWIQTDLVSDDLHEYFDGVHTVYHLAARFLPGNSNAVFDELYPLNVTGTKRLAKVAVEKSVNTFIHISSVAACEVGDDSLINEDNGQPASSYGLTKQKGEEALIDTAKGKMDYVIFRPTALFGEHHLGSIYELVKAIKKRIFFIIGDGKNHLNFMYIKDFTEILENARDCESIVNRIYISNDTPISLIELVHLIQRYLNLPLTRLHIPLKVGKAVGFLGSFISNIFGVTVPLTKNRIAAMTRDVCYSVQKLQKDMDYRLRYGMEVGLSNTIKWYQQQNLT